MRRIRKEVKEESIAWPYKPKHPFSIGLMEIMRERGINSYYTLSTGSQVPLSTCRDMFSSNYKGPTWETIDRLATYFELSHSNFARSLEKKYMKKKKKKR